MSPEEGEPFSFDVSHRPELPHLPGVFITSAGRGEGKTLVAGAVARHLRHAGRDVAVFHPMATGCRHGRGGLVSGEADFLAACADSRMLLSEIAPVRTSLPAAPAEAADEPTPAVDLEALFEAWRRLAAEAEAAVVEGAGGLLGQITDDFWTLHLARMLALPVVLVVRPGPGALNHALLTVHVARSAGLELAGVVVNHFLEDTAAEPDAAVYMQTQPARIAHLAGVDILAVVPEDAANSIAKATLAESAQFAIDQAPWETIVFGRP